jgi:ribosomal protein S18 acetylase RimI-like enzyme
MSWPEVRRLLPGDAACYRCLMLDAYRAHPDLFTTGPNERTELPLSWWESRLAEGEDASSVVFGAFVEGELAGVAGLLFETREKIRHKASLFGMYVVERYRKFGIGRALVEAALAGAASRDGVEVVQLTVTDSNVAARGLYERCGFAEFGVEPYAIKLGNCYVGKVHMWCWVKGE